MKVKQDRINVCVNERKAGVMVKMLEVKMVKVNGQDKIRLNYRNNSG